MLAIASWIFSSTKSARSISALISSSPTRARISASSCQRVICFCWRLALCWFSLTACVENCETSPVTRTSIADEKIIRVAEDLWPPRCLRFLKSSSAISALKIHRKFNSDFTHHSLATWRDCRLISIGFYPVKKNHVQDFSHWTVFSLTFRRLHS
jgi:hypothetical protein